MSDRPEQIQSVIKRLDTLITDVTSLGLSDAVHMMKILRLELITNLHGIRPDELADFSRAVADGAIVVQPRSIPQKP
jgi:hypothetical protein